MIDLVNVIAMSSDSGGGILALLALGPAGAIGTYWLVYRYYRNTDKSHAFERETLIHAQPVAGEEEKVGHISKTKDSEIDGDNSDSYRARVQRRR